MIYRNVSDAKAELSKLIELALQGELVVLGKAGKPLIQFEFYNPSRKRRKPGRLSGQLIVPESFNEFDASLESLFDID